MAIYIMRTEFFDRSKETGFNKYNELADHFRRIIAVCGSLRDDLNIFMMMHIETVEADGSIIGYKSSSVGKLLDKMYRPEENGFYTHRMKVNGIEVPAKTPEGMFEEDFIPNDLGTVVKAMKEYYG